MSGGNARACSALVAIVVVAGLMLSATVHAAQIHYAPPTIPGDTVTFPVVNESSGTDAVPLYGAPTTPVSNNTLTFDNMSGFSATSTSGSPMIDFIDGLLNVTVQANSGHFITGFDFSEFGDYSLGRIVNTLNLAWVQPTTPGILITIREVNGVAVNIGPTVVPLTYLATPPYTFTGSALVENGTWTANAAYLFTVPNVTRFELSINNQLYAASEVGTSASVSKKGLDLQVITSPEFVPEPASLSGLMLLMLIARRRR